MNKTGLLNAFGELYSESSFCKDIEGLDKHFHDQMILCGGWLPDYERAMEVRCAGIYWFDEGQSGQIFEIAENLGRIYSKLGQSIERGGSLRELALSMLPSFERELMVSVLGKSPWASSLRADVVFDGNGQAKVLEVNSDNVAGLEAIDITLRYYLEAYGIGSESELGQALGSLNNSLVNLISECWQWFSGAGQPSISVAFEDRETGFFASRYLSQMLAKSGFKVGPAASPEHFRRRGGKLWCKETLWGEVSVDILFRDWLSFEMYSQGAAGLEELGDKFRSLFEASRSKEVLVISSFADRLLFSKEWMVELWAASERRNSMLAEVLSEEDLVFIERYFAPSFRYVPPVDVVVKAADSFGGRDVHMIDEDSPVAIQQSRVRGDKLISFFRDDKAGVMGKKDLHSVHGVLIHTNPSGQGRLAGVMTRVGPKPVVNWSSGAQFLPGVVKSTSRT